MSTMRVDQLLSRYGYCSRREARMWCNAERVSLNGKPLRFSDKVDVHQVLVDDEHIDYPDGLFVLLHKPVGYVCSHEQSEGLRVYDLLPEQWQRREPKVVSIGRLDKDTSGLLIVTDQSEWVHRLTSPKHHVQKRYIATLDKTPEADLVEQFAAGILLKHESKPCLPAVLEILDQRRVAVSLAEGKYHQVRRMFAACGYHVDALHRTDVGNWSIGSLAEGEWTTTEIPSLSTWSEE